MLTKYFWNSGSEELDLDADRQTSRLALPHTSYDLGKLPQLPVPVSSPKTWE